MAESTATTYIFAEALEAKFNEEVKGTGWEYKLTAKAGRKFDKIFISSSLNGGTEHTSIHAFIDRETGGVFKAAGLNQPAKGVRFSNIIDAIEKADRYGSYLYA